MTPINNISINTLDKAYNVLGIIKKEITNSNENDLNKIQQVNDIAVDDQINYNINDLKLTDDNKIDSQDELKNILSNVKTNIENIESFDIHSLDVSNNISNLLQQ